MYKYTINPIWKHYFKEKYGKYCSYYRNIPTKVFTDAGWPKEYAVCYWVIHFLPTTEYYSPAPLRAVPVKGFLIPLNFFEESII